MYMADAKTGSVESAPGSRELNTEQGYLISHFLSQNSNTLELSYFWSRIKATKSSSTFLQATAYVHQEQGKGT